MLNEELKSVLNILNEFSIANFASISDTSRHTFSFCIYRSPPVKFQTVQLYFNEATLEISKQAFVFDKSSLLANLEAIVIT